MRPQPSVPRNWYARPTWARTLRTAAVLPVLLLVLFLPGAAYAGGGGVPSPDPSTQIAPDPAPSGGELGTHGGGGQTPAQQPAAPSTPSVSPTSPSASQSVPVTTSPASTVHAATTTHHKPRHHRHVVAKHHGAPHVKVDPAPRLSTLFASSLTLALHAPTPVARVEGGGSGDALALAAIALLLLVVTSLMVVRTSAQVLRRERPA
jgi:hypothetical protein